MQNDENFKELFIRLITNFKLAPDKADRLLKNLLMILSNKSDEAEK